MSFRKLFKKKEELDYETEFKEVKKYIENENLDGGFNYLKKLRDQMGENISEHSRQILNVLECTLLDKANKIPDNLTLISSLENKIKDQLMYLDFTIAKADTYWKAGKQQEALETLESIEPKVEKMKNDRSEPDKTNLDIVEREADINNIKGIVYWQIGEVIKSQNAFQKSLTLRGMLGNKRSFADSLNNLGNVLTYKGEIESALEHQMQALEIRKNLPNKEQLASSYGNIGEIFHYMGEYDRALEFYEEAKKIFDNLDNKLFRASLYYKLITLHLEYNNHEKAEEYLPTLAELANAPDANAYIKTFYTFSEGLILKDSDRLMKKFKAGENFSAIANGPVIDSEITVQAIFNLNDILLLELRLSQNEDILNEVHEWSDKVIKLAEDQNSASLIVQSYLLDSKLKLLDFKVQEAKEILLKGQETANKKGILKFEYFISRELDQLLSQEEKWEELKATGASLMERIDLTGLEQTLNNLIRKREEFTEVESEEPVLFMILLDEGLSAFSSKFNSNISLDDQLIAGFMSAVNTFGQQVFSTIGSVERIKHGEFTIISKKVENTLTFCYAFKGPSYLAVKKLDKISIDFSASELSKTMLKKMESNQLLEGEEEQSLNKLINDIVYSQEKDLREPIENQIEN